MTTSPPTTPKPPDAARPNPELAALRDENLALRRRIELDAAVREAEQAELRRARQRLLHDPLPGPDIFFGDPLAALVDLTRAALAILAEPGDAAHGPPLVLAASAPPGELDEALRARVADVLAEVLADGRGRVVGDVHAEPLDSGGRVVGALALRVPPEQLDPGRLAALRLMGPTFGLLLDAYRDAAARRRARTERDAEARRLAWLVDHSDDAVLLGDAQGTIAWVSPSFTRIFGHTLDDARGRHPGELLGGPESDSTVWQRCRTHDGVVVRDVVTLYARDGSRRWIAVEGRLLVDAVAGTTSSIVLLRDRSALRTAEHLRHESEARLQAIGDALHDVAIRQVVFDAGHAGRNVYASAGAAALWDRDGDLDGLDPMELLARVPASALDAVMAAGQDDLLAGRPVRAEIPLQLRDGRTRWIGMYAAARRLDDGTVLWDVVDVDITARKTLEASLRDAMRAAEGANAAKSMFLAHVSHELRTPLNGILGITELLLDDPLPTGVRERLAIVHRSGEWLLDLVNDLLDFARIEAGKLVIEEAPFELELELGHVLKPLAAHARRKGLNLGLELSPETPCQVVGDRTRLRQLVVNLVGNAIKFTERGSVRVVVDTAPAGGEGLDLRVRVHDTGIGLAPERRHKIFEPFEQGDMTTGRRDGGTGLGLAICTRLVALMGGAIGVESTPGVGSTFWFTIRVRGGDETIAARDHATAVALWESDVRAHVIDEAGMPELVASLRRWGVELVPDAAPPRYDLALVDGTGAAPFGRIAMLRAAGFEGPVIALSDALAPREERVADGAVVTLLRPFSTSELLATIARAVSRKRPTLAPAAAGRRARLRVLVAEDNEVNQLVTTAVLTRAGHEVRLVADGAAAVLAHSCEYFDVLLIDVQMDRMDGLAATRAIRQRERGGPRVPILGVTAHATPDALQRCRAAGMDDIVTKPFRISTLEEALHSAVREPARAATRASQADDLPMILEQGAPQLLAELRQAVAREDASAVAAAAHRLAGALAQVDAHAALIAARRLAELAGRGHLTGAHAALERLEDGLAAAPPPGHP